ncbi:MAG: class I adenylate-forming enzyme family protein [Eubacteriales bacterium]|nr:class I adenylate-forming enzyme family protein [Eubacteriales bacterium]
MQSIVEAVAVHAAEEPGRLCVADGKTEFTYQEFWEHIAGYARHLAETGVKAGDRVVVRNAQNVSQLVAGLAIQLAGAIFVPIEKNAADNRIQEILDITEAKCYIAAKELQTECICEKMSSVLSFEWKNAKSEEFSFPKSEDMAEILFTTGTTGKSKGIELTHASVTAVAENVIYGLEMKKNNVELIPTPLSHSHGLRRYYANILNGSSVLILDGVIFTKKLFQMMDDYHVSAIDLVPAALAALFKLCGDRLGEYSEQLDYVQLGSAPIPQEDKERLRRLLPNTRLYNFYGTTEAGCSCILDFNAYPDKVNCIGRPTCHSKFIFADENGNEVNASEENPGLLACAGEMNMKGYYKSPELTAETLRGGFVYTNDLSYQDAEGFIYVLGRRGDVIETGGNKVAPDEIEETARKCPGVEDCACVPMEDPILGKAPKLFVQLAAGTEFVPENIYQFLREQLEAYKVPKVIEKIDKVPRTYNGKIQRKQLM